MPLTDTAIRAAKPREKPYKLADTGGLFLYVAPKGGKLWRMKYRHAGKEGLLSFGPYPAVSLKAAREKRDESRRQIEGGRNPAVEKRREEARARLEASTTFKAVADEVIAKAAKEGKAPATLRAARRYLSLLKRLHASPVADIEPIELLDVLRPLETKGRHETALKTRAFAGRVFRHAVLTARARANPAEALRGALTAPKVTHLAAILEPAQAGALMRAIEGYDGQPATRLALQLMAHLFVRPGELRQARWPEIDFEAAIWRIPATRMKMKREHVVPLSRQALEAFRQVQAIHPGGPLVFPSLGSLDRPMSENTLNAALRRLGYAKGEMTSHGFRAMASTLLNESGKWTPDAIERALAHADTDGVRAAYHRGAHWQERVKMMRWWSDHLDALRTGAQILKLRKGG
jgi:integrase